jgi:apolipoprotein N-acyltransferase
MLGSVAVVGECPPRARPEPNDVSFRPLLSVLALLGIVGLTAAGQAAVSPPRGRVLVHPVCWVAAFLWINRCRPWGAFWSGWLLGAAAHAATFHWIVQLEVIRPLYVKLLALLGLSLVNGLALGAFAAGWRRVRRATGDWWPAGVAAWFTACEFLNWQFFPYYQGCAYWEQGWIFPVTSLTGVTFLTFLAVLCNALVLLRIEARFRGTFPTRAWRGNLAILGGCLVAACGWSALQRACLARQERSAPVTRIALLQPGDQFPRPGEPHEPTAAKLLRFTREAVARDPSIRAAVWPEAAVYSETEGLSDNAAVDLARQLGIEVWTGVSLKARPGEAPSNAAVRIDAAGQPSGLYVKCLLAPFGESVPLAEFFPWLERLRGRPARPRGPGPRVYETPAGRIAFLICYEAIRYDYVRSVMRHRPDLLVVISSDRWAGPTTCRDQHFMMTAINAAQFGVPVVRCCAAGTCGLTGPAGGPQARSSEGPGVVCAVRRGRLPAPYVWLGDWFAWGCVVASATALGRGKSRP